MSPGVAIVGCGLIGRKRAAALPGGRLVACADLVLERAEALARDFALGAGAAGPATRAPVAVPRWQEVVTRPDVDMVIVATTNESLAEVTRAALDAGKHVLVEKPAARTVAELEPLVATARERGLRVRVGFNHRYHPALQKAHEIVTSGQLGPLMFVRGRYGHGGRVGYDKEWRADPARSGGGELIDQGVHLIDLSAWFLGPFTSVAGFAATYFWDMPVDDNAFLTLRTEGGQCAFLHVSCSEWKNLFSLEIYGRTGKLDLFGLGGSYGVERITWYRMLPEMGPPETTSWEYPRGDRSWALEFAEFVEDLRQGREPSPGLAEAKHALEVVEAIYRQSGSSGSRLPTPDSRR
jgi:predicted dehydrogenase